MQAPAEQRPLSGLRIAFAAFDPFPNRKGSGTRIHELTTGLAAAGAEVTVLSLSGTCADAAPPGVEVRPLRLAEDNYLCRAMMFRNVVARELVALRPDVVHFRGPFEGQAALAYATSHGVKTLFEVNGLPSVELRYHYPGVVDAPDFEAKLRSAEQRLLVAADQIITQSHATERFLRLRGMPLLKAAVIPNGACPDRFHPAPASPPPAVPRLLYVGTLAPWQGLLDLLVALRRASRHHPMHLDIVGWGQKAWRRAIDRAARRLKVHEHINILPATGREELASLVRDSDICNVPLRADRRNRVQGCSPIKLFEYMAAGKAILATSLPCIQELLSSGDNGLLARPSRPHDLGARLLTLATDPALRTRLGRRAREDLLTSATWCHRRQALVEFYRTRLLAREYS